MEISNSAVKEKLFKYKNSTLKFFCPLCRYPRNIAYSSKLTRKNYWQICLISILLICVLYPYVALKSSPVFFFIWAVFDFSKRVLFKKNLPCPHCGFDASLYKKDVNKTKKVVHDFWEAKKKVVDV